MNLPVAENQFFSHGPDGLRGGVVVALGQEEVDVLKSRPETLKLSIDETSVASFEGVIGGQEEEAFATRQGCGKLGGFQMNTFQI